MQQEIGWNFTLSQFSTLLKEIPALKNHMDSPRTTVVNLHGYVYWNFKILFESVAKGSLEPLVFERSADSLGESSYDIVDLYTLADLLKLYDLCDETMDMMMSVYWDSLPRRIVNGTDVEIEADSPDGIFASLEDIATAYARTGPGSPLRKFMVATLEYAFLYFCYYSSVIISSFHYLRFCRYRSHIKELINH